ncbi:MAG: PilW family protein, partial [Steroidobacteraceae bacterium]
MNRPCRSFVLRRRMAGLSLIEMMIALVMALIVAAGIITVFESTSSSNRVQAQMATLQEEGRFAIHSMRADLANANGGYCSSTGGNATTTASGLALDSLNAPIVVSKDMTDIQAAFADNTTPLDAATTPFYLPSFLYMRGYDCTVSQCFPIDPKGVPPNGIPAMGTAIGDRVPGTAVLTVRYLVPGSGWAIFPSGSAKGSTLTSVGTGSANHVTAIDLARLPDEDPVASFGAGDLAMLADCSSAYVFSVSGQGSSALTLNNNYATPVIRDNSSGAAARVFDFEKAFQTVTYYVKVVDAGNGHKTGE